jgi:hypothetical protein
MTESDPLPMSSVFFEEFPGSSLKSCTVSEQQTEVVAGKAADGLGKAKIEEDDHSSDLGQSRRYHYADSGAFTTPSRRPTYEDATRVTNYSTEMTESDPVSATSGELPDVSLKSGIAIEQRTEVVAARTAAVKRAREDVLDGRNTKGKPV